MPTRDYRSFVRPEERPSRVKRVVLWMITIGIVVPGAYGFISKFIEFVRTLQLDADGGFTIIPIMNYLIVTLGMICLLIWAVARGMFRDVERPKYTMLEREAMLDAREHRQGG